MWDKQVQHLTNCHCVTVDLPEQGQSAPIDEFSIESSAHRINELIHELANGKDIIVIGFSLGAQVLVQMLSDRPDLITYAIINSALVKPNKLRGKLISPLIHLTFPLIKNKTFQSFKQKHSSSVKNTLKDIITKTCQMERMTLVRILKENMSFAVPAEFSKAKGKILVTVGEKEKAVMKKSATELVYCNENCTEVIISKVGHGAPLAKPDLFNQIIKKWITGEKLPKECKEIV